MKCFHILYPGRTTACKLGQRMAPGQKTPEKFRSFFHDCQICRKCHVQYIIRPQLPEGRYHTAFHKVSGPSSEALPQSHTNRWSRRKNNNLLRGIDCPDHLSPVAFTADCPLRTDCRALPAVDAGKSVCTFICPLPGNADFFRAHGQAMAAVCTEILIFFN